MIPSKECLAQTQKLREILGPLPEGPGADWLIKALHPSDPITEVRGVPDQSSMPTTLLNWQTDVVIEPAAAATGTWSADLTIVPDPCMFGRWKMVDSVGTTYGFAVNTQLGSTYDNAIQALMGGAERWRLAYAGVTIYQDGPTLSDQGTVVAAQVPIEPTLHTCSHTYDAGGGNLTSLSGVLAERFQATDIPDYQTLVRMPNAYFSQSKFGVYMPVKLSTNHQQWHSAKDVVWDVTGWAADPAGSGKVQSLVVPGVDTYAQFPYGGNTAGVVSGQRSPFINVGNGFNASSAVRSRLMNENWGHACFQNMSVSTRLIAYFRFGVEVQCLPTSLYAPYLKLSPPYDREAIDAYFKISREMKDAYPSDYNDLGKLWSVIKTVARKVLPAVGMMGPFGAAVSTIGGALLGSERSEKKLKDEIPKPSSSGQAIRDSPPAAAVERAQEAAAATKLQRKLTVVRKPVSRPLKISVVRRRV